MNSQNRKTMVLIVLGGIFITNAIVAELTGGKLIQVGPWVLSMGVIMWPVVFITTDLINEYFGKAGVRRLTLITVGLIIYTFMIIFVGIKIPAAEISPVKDDAFTQVFGQSLWIIVGSITAFAFSQWIDVFTFWILRGLSHGKLLWLRATGSTVISQLVDSYVVSGIAFLLPGKITLTQYLGLTFFNYIYKLLVAVALTPVIYVGHDLVDRFLGEDLSEEMIEEAAKNSVLSQD